MISMAAIGGTGAASSYYTKDNYYTDRDASEASAWAGQGAEQAGLSGPVGVDEFREILEGKMPDGTVLQPGRDGHHRAGMDMTFSAPKSVSLLAYVGGDERLLAANMAAVKTTLAWAEKNLAEAREGKNGKTEVVKTGNLVVALFQHDTNRNLDPQAHVHAVIANATKGTDGKWHALHNDKLWANNTLLGSIYHAQLKANVEALGYETTPAGKHGSFEIAGVSRQAVEAFSTRRAEILAAAEAKLDYLSPQGLRAVTLRTRNPKPTVENRGELQQSWRDRAAGIGLDLSPVVAAALDRVEGRDNPSTWESIVTGIKGAIERTTAVAGFVRDRVGLGQSEIDPYLPRGANYLKPAEYGAASAVASALRHLTEREASFDIHAVYKAALDLGLPVQIGNVEASVATLLREGKLVRGVDGRRDQLTTPAALVTERSILAAAELGRGVSSPIVADASEAGRRLQDAAQARSGITLDPGQESAGRLLLAGTDRIVNVQGVAGSGKSTVLGAIAEVARAEGHNVLALGPQNTLVQDLARDSGIAAITIAKFVRTHEKLLMEKTFPERLDLARAMFKGAIVMVDEASMSSNSQTAKLLDLANRLDFKLALVGDKQQLGAVEAGKPFEIMQRAGVATAYMTENLRSRTPELKEATALANAGRTRAAFDKLAASISEAPGRMSTEAAERWLRGSPAERSTTLLMASGRAVRTELNTAVQQGLLAEQSIGGAAATLTIRDSINLTREQERFAANYPVGAHIEFTSRIQAQKITRGEGVVRSVDHKSGIVEIDRGNGKTDRFNPSRLSETRSDSNVRVSTEKTIPVHEGDLVRWTDNDHKRGLLNSARAQILSIDATGIKVRTAAELEITLPHGDPMLARLDLGYAMNTHMLQGATANRAIGVMDSRETNLANARLFLVNITRVRDGIEIIVDDSNRIGMALDRNSGDKTAALETIGALGDRTSPTVASPSPPAPEHQPSATTASPKAPTPPPAEKPDPQPIPVRERTMDSQMDIGL